MLAILEKNSFQKICLCGPGKTFQFNVECRKSIAEGPDCSFEVVSIRVFVCPRMCEYLYVYVHMIKWIKDVEGIRTKLQKTTNSKERGCGKRGKWYMYLIHFCGLGVVLQGSCVKCMMVIR